jgi:hypothetical protein
MTEDEFINLATEKGPDKKNIRTSLAGYFHTVQKTLPCAHYVYDALYISHHILKTHHIPGDIAEFGCFEGGMSAKLAKVAQLTGKKYYIFDSFTGLPHEASYETYDPELQSIAEFTKNQYSCSIKKVQEKHILNPDWWHENLNSKPPKFQGKPGLQLAGCLDFLYKDENYTL